MEVEITSENFENYKNGDLPLVMDLWATWCGPCRMVSPIMSELAKDYDGKVVIGKCNVEDNDDIAMQFGVRNIPTVLFFKGGQLVDKFVGAAAKEKYAEPDHYMLGVSRFWFVRGTPIVLRRVRAIHHPCARACSCRLVCVVGKGA